MKAEIKKILIAAVAVGIQAAVSYAAKETINLLLSNNENEEEAE